jgi:hypothetical protein
MPDSAAERAAARIVAEHRSIGGLRKRRDTVVAVAQSVSPCSFGDIRTALG